MSKSKGNVVDPWMLMQNYGADATRWYMYASAPPYNPRFAPEHGRGAAPVCADVWNTTSFFVTYANLADAHRRAACRQTLQPIDRWLAQLHAHPRCHSVRALRHPRQPS
jgi:isoleucyl-tRNA synthetase